jgi:hypothetical protein
VVGTDIYLLVKTDLSEMKRIERPPGDKFHLMEHHEMGWQRGLRMLKKFHHVRAGAYESEVAIDYGRAGRAAQLPAHARITWHNAAADAAPARFFEADFDGCSVLERAPERVVAKPPEKPADKPADKTASTTDTAPK